MGPEGCMEFLRDLFGDGALSFEAFCAKTRGAGREGADMKLADLSQGNYVGLEKHRASVAERNALRQKLAEAERAVEALKAPDAEGLREEAEQWRQKAELAREEAELVLRDAAYQAALERAAGGLEFTSKGARTAFLQALRDAELPLEDGRLAGFEGFAEAYRAEDPAAIFGEEAPPRFAAPGMTPAGSEGWRERAARNYAKAKAEG